MGNWTAGIPAITLFVDDLAEAVEFYGRVFDLEPHYADEVSTVFIFGPTMINLLDSSDAVSLIAPARVAEASAGTRMQFTLNVDDVDAKVAELASKGVTLLNGPMDREWGIRTAAFCDPAGHVWELAAPLAK